MSGCEIVGHFFYMQANGSMKKGRGRAGPGILMAVLSEGDTKARTMPITLDFLADSVSAATVSCFTVTCPGLSVFTYTLGGDAIHIGRDAECEIQLPLTSVSRQHARISFVGEEYRIEDLDSTNGIWVNNIRVAQCVLHHNDCLRIGAATLVFQQQAGSQTS